MEINDVVWLSLETICSGYDLVRIFVLSFLLLLVSQFLNFMALPFGLAFEVPLKLFEIVPYVVVVDVESVDIFSYSSIPTLFCSFQSYSQSNLPASKIYGKCIQNRI